MTALRQLSLFDDLPPPVSTSSAPPWVPALSLDQPWASLVALGLKRFETRSWQRGYRGLIAIHATVKPFRIADYANGGPDDFSAQLYRLQDERKFDFWSLPYRAVIAVANVVDMVPVEAIRDMLSQQELAFGDYSSSGKQRYAWKLENVRAFPRPIERPGGQQLWHWHVSPDEWAMIQALKSA